MVGKSTLLHAVNHGEMYEVATNYDHNSHSIDSTYLSPFLQEDHGKILQRSLHKFEISRRNILAKYYNENNGYTVESIIPDVYDPLKQLLHLLMPHLISGRADIDDDDNSSEDVNCLL